MKRNAILTILCTLALGTGACFAEVYPHDEAGVSVTIPDNWEVDQEGEDAMVAHSPDEKVYLIFFVIDADDDEAGNKITKMLEEEITDIEETAEEKTTELKGGFTGTVNEGTGVIEAIGKVHLGTLLFENKGKKILVVGAKSSEEKSKFEGDIDKIIDSLRKIE